MLDKFKNLLKKNQQNEELDGYIGIPKNEINQELKIKIIKLEKLGEEISNTLQKRYVNEFEKQEKKELRIWVCRDIDGDELQSLTVENCFDLEYRSQIAIDFIGQKYDEEFYASTIYLWHYFKGVKVSGTLYDLSNNDLEVAIENELIRLLNKNCYENVYD